MQTQLGLATIGVSVFGLICIAISLGINYWAIFETETYKYNIGLWRYCRQSKEGRTWFDRFRGECEEVTGFSEVRDTVRAMLYLGLICVCGGICCVAAKIFGFKASKAFLCTAVVFYFCAGLFLMIGFAVFHGEFFKQPGDETKQKLDIKPHAGFALCIIAWPITWVAAGLSAVMARTDERQEEKPSKEVSD